MFSSDELLTYLICLQMDGVISSTRSNDAQELKFTLLTFANTYVNNLNNLACEHEKQAWDRHKRKPEKYPDPPVPLPKLPMVDPCLQKEKRGFCDPGTALFLAPAEDFATFVKDPTKYVFILCIPYATHRCT